jgi:hypothetical protein
MALRVFIKLIYQAVIVAFGDVFIDFLIVFQLTKQLPTPLRP